jgi:hypothetical protein
MKKLSVFCAALALSFAFSSARAGSVDTHFVADRSEEKTPLDLFSFEGSYVFESKLSHDDFEFGDQTASELEIEYSHRFHLTGRWYLRAGLNYNRFDFGSTAAPVPNHLQSFAALLSIDYMVGPDRGAFLELRPGFYGQDDFREEAFDMPITLARAWVLRPNKIFLITGVNYAFLRGELPVVPVVGLVWHISDQWLLYGVVPEPRMIYMPNKKLDLWVGGQLTGGSFRTNRNDTIVPRSLSNAQVDYSDYRASAGLTWHACDAVDLEIGGGYSIQRRFNFERAGEDFTTDPAPFVKLALKAEF